MCKYKLIINAKTYDESFDDNLNDITLAIKELKEKAKQKDVDIILCPQIFDIKDALKEEIQVFAQHIDPFGKGAHTGYVIPQELKELGVQGTLISHSEHILPIDEINKRILKANESNLQTCVCARDLRAAKNIAKLNPTFVAVEPKELIGGDISITTANPQLIIDSLDVVTSNSNNSKLLVGAGVKTTQDVKKSIELGASGILAATTTPRRRRPCFSSRATRTASRSW